MARGKKAAQGLTPEEKLAQALVPVEEQPYQIPNNWCYCHLNGITEHLKRGKAPKYVEHSEIPVFAQKCNQKDGKISLEKAQFLNPEYGEKIDESEFLQDNDIIVNSTGTGTLGRVGLFKLSFVVPYDRVLPDSHITTIRTIKHIIPEYVYYYLKYKQEYLELQGVGSTNQKELRPETLANLKIPLSPLAEQQRIVDRIESIFAKLDEAKEKAQAVVDGFELRKSAILHNAFMGELTAKWREEHGVTLDSWQHKKFSELCNIVRGGSPRPAGNPEFYDGSIPFMKVADITQNNSPFVSTTEYTIKEAGLKKTRMVDENTLLLTNSGATLGVPAITKIRTTFNDGIAAFLNLKSENLMFFYYFWTSKTLELRGINKGAAQPNLNTNIIGNVEIDLPTEAEQSQIVVELDRLINKEDQAKEAAESVLNQIDAMKKAVLARAFRGELGTNDPAEESAVELLKTML